VNCCLEIQTLSFRRLSKCLCAAQGDEAEEKAACEATV
jgi:hypothetical protein